MLHYNVHETEYASHNPLYSSDKVNRLFNHSNLMRLVIGPAEYYALRTREVKGTASLVSFWLLSPRISQQGWSQYSCRLIRSTSPPPAPSPVFEWTWTGVNIELPLISPRYSPFCNFGALLHQGPEPSTNSIQRQSVEWSSSKISRNTGEILLLWALRQACTLLWRLGKGKSQKMAVFFDCCEG